MNTSFQIPDLAADFAPPTADEWLQAAAALLNGADFDKALKTLTYEGILLNPIYPLSAGHPAPVIPGMHPRPAWYVTQPLSGKTVAELKSEWQQNKSNGQTGVLIPAALFTQKNWQDFFIGRTFENTLVALPGGLPIAIQDAILNQPELQQSQIWIQNETVDPVLLSAISPDSLNPAARLWAVNTINWQESGANAVQELAIALSATVQLVKQLSDSGIEPKATLTRLVWRMAIGANFFTEIAKFRAARVLYAALAEAWQLSAENMPLFLAAQTSRSNKSRYDRHVNILRATGETFAAALSGVDSITVLPFDAPTGQPSELGQRLARNTQLVIAEESQVSHLRDAAAGSGYVEELTRQLAEKSWVLFNQIEQQGGLKAVINSGWLKDEIAKVAGQRRHNAATLRDKYIGINAFPIAGEMPGAAADESCFSPFIEFEQLRDRMNAYILFAGRTPKACLLNFGALSGYKPRADFSEAFLALGEMTCEAVGPFPTMVDAVHAARESKAEIVVLCAADEVYPEIVADFCRQFRTVNISTVLVLAGHPGLHEADFRSAGIDVFIHRKVNVVVVIGELQRRLGVGA